MNRKRKSSVVRRIVMLVCVMLALVVVYSLMERSGTLAAVTDTDRLKAWISGLGYGGPAMLIALMAIAIIINPIPSAPIALAAGAVYGHLWGTVYVVTGATIGALGAFGIARLLGYDLLYRVFGSQLKLGWLGSQNTLTGMVFVSRLLPFLSFDLVSYGAGLTPIKGWRFALATLFGLIPASFLLAHFGGELSASNLQQAGRILLILGALTLVPVIVTAIVKWRRGVKKGH